MQVVGLALSQHRPSHVEEIEKSTFAKSVERCCRTKRRAASRRPKYKDYFTDDASLSDSAALDDEDDDEDDEDDDFLSEISMREGHYGMQSRNSSLQSADASHFKSSGGFSSLSALSL